MSIINKVYRDTGTDEVINTADAVEWAAEALELIGAAFSYQEKVEVVPVKDYRAKLPLGLHYIQTAGAVKTDDTFKCPELHEFVQMRYSTDAYHHYYCKDNNDCRCNSEYTYKVNEDFMFTNFANGYVIISYKRIPLDCDGLPTIPDDIKFRQAVSYFIQERLAFIKWSQGKMPGEVYAKLEQQRDWYMGSANTRANMPSVDMLESIKNNWLRLIPKINQHSDGFKSMGTPEMRFTHNSINSSTNALNTEPDRTFFHFEDGARPISITGDQALLYTPKDGELVYITQTNSTFTVIGYYKYSTDTNSWIKQ